MQTKTMVSICFEPEWLSLRNNKNWQGYGEERSLFPAGGSISIPANMGIGTAVSKVETELPDPLSSSR